MSTPNPFHAQFESHPAFKTLRDIETRMENFKVDALTPELLVEVERFKRVMRFVRACLDACDPELMPLQILSNVQSYLAQFSAAFQNFQNNPQGHAGTLRQQTDGHLPPFFALPCWAQINQGERAKLDLAGFQKTALDAIARVAAAEQEANKRIDTLKQQAAGLVSQVSALTQQVAQAQQTITQLSGQFQQQHTQAQGTRQTEFDAWKKTIKDEATKTIEARNAELATELASAKTKISDLLKTNQAAFTAALVDDKARADTAHAGNESTAKAATKFLDDQVALARKLIGLLGQDAEAGKYQKVANDHRKDGNLFRWIAIGCIGAAILTVIGIVGYFWWESAHGNHEAFSWSATAFRMTASLPFAAAAWYCGVQSSKHFKLETVNRQRECELVALPAYLSRLTDEEARQVLKDLAPRYFGADSHDASEESMLDKLSAKDVIELLKQTSSAVKNIKN